MALSLIDRLRVRGNGKNGAAHDKTPPPKDGSLAWLEQLAKEVTKGEAMPLDENEALRMQFEHSMDLPKIEGTLERLERVQAQIDTLESTQKQRGAVLRGAIDLHMEHNMPGVQMTRYEQNTLEQLDRLLLRPAVADDAIQALRALRDEYLPAIEEWKLDWAQQGLVAHHGELSELVKLSDHSKQTLVTAWEIHMKVIMDGIARVAQTLQSHLDTLRTRKEDIPYEKRLFALFKIEPDQNFPDKSEQFTTFVDTAKRFRDVFTGAENAWKEENGDDAPFLTTAEDLTLFSEAMRPVLEGSRGNDSGEELRWSATEEREVLQRMEEKARELQEFVRRSEHSFGEWAPYLLPRLESLQERVVVCQDAGFSACLDDTEIQECIREIYEADNIPGLPGNVKREFGHLKLMLSMEGSNLARHNHDLKEKYESLPESQQILINALLPYLSSLSASSYEAGTAYFSLRKESNNTFNTRNRILMGLILSTRPALMEAGNSEEENV